MTDDELVLLLEFIRVIKNNGEKQKPSNATHHSSCYRIQL